MDKVWGNIDHVKNVVHRLIPLIEKESFVFDWSKVYSIIDSVDSAGDELKNVQLAEFFFTEILGNFDQLTDSCKGKPSIILGDDS